MATKSIEQAREHLQEWIGLERGGYADRKYEEGGANRTKLIQAMETEGFGNTWMDFAGNYIKRAQLFGADTLQGRQAMGKAIVTMMHMLETAVVVHGDMPAPGVSSTEGVQEW